MGTNSTEIEMDLLLFPHFAPFLKTSLFSWPSSPVFTKRPLGACHLAILVDKSTILFAKSLLGGIESWWGDILTTFNLAQEETASFSPPCLHTWSEGGGRGAKKRKWSKFPSLPQFWLRKGTERQERQLMGKTFKASTPSRKGSQSPLPPIHFNWQKD